MENNEFKVNEQFLAFKDKKVTIGLRTNIECEGTLIAIDNYLNSVLETDEGTIQTIKGVEINYISLKED